MIEVYKRYYKQLIRKLTIKELLTHFKFLCPGGDLTPMCDMCGANPYCIELRTNIDPDCFNDLTGDGVCEHAVEGEDGETKPICTIIGISCCRQEIIDKRPVFYQIYCNSSDYITRHNVLMNYNDSESMKITSEYERGKIDGSKVEREQLLNELALFIDNSEDLIDTRTHGKAVLVHNLVDWMVSRGYEP